MPTVPIVLSLVACDPEGTPPPSGTSVGNPGKNYFRLGETPGMVVEAAVASGLTFDLVSCEGLVERAVADEVVDLLDGEAVAVNGREWCAVVVQIEDGLLLVGVGEGGESLPFEVELAFDAPLTLWVVSPIPVDGESYVIELGAPGWLSAEQLGLDVEPVNIGPEQEVHDLLLVAVLEQSAWWLDAEDDGEVGPADRDAGPIASAANLPPDEMQVAEDAAVPNSVGIDGCNCAAAAPGGAWVMAPIAGLALRRRRRVTARG